MTILHNYVTRGCPTVSNSVLAGRIEEDGGDIIPSDKPITNAHIRFR